MPGLTRICTLKGHDERVWCVAWRPCSQPPQFASCGSDRVIRVWSLQRGASFDAEDSWTLACEVDATDRHSRTLRSLAWTPDGKVAAVTSFDATVSLWIEAKDRKLRPGQDLGGTGLQFECVGIVSGHENEVKDASFSPSGEYFATCSRDKSIWIYEADLQNFEFECVALLRGDTQSHTQDVKAVRWHPSQDILFSCSYDDTIKVWGPDGDDWSCKETFPDHESTVWSIGFDRSGAHLVSCSEDKTVKVWMPAEEAKNLPAPPKSISYPGIAHFVTPLFRPAMQTQAPTGTTSLKPRKPPADASCRWTCVATIEGYHPRPIYHVDWLPCDNASCAIATACGDNHIRVFQPVDQVSVNSWRCVADIEAHDGDANTVAWCPFHFSDDAAILASAGDDCEVVLWRFER